MQLDGVPKHREHDGLHASHVALLARTKPSSQRWLLVALVDEDTVGDRLASPTATHPTTPCRMTRSSERKWGTASGHATRHRW